MTAAPPLSAMRLAWAESFPRDADELLYTVDMLLPFVDLGYSRWVPHGRVLTVTTVLVGLGWVLATAVVAAFADVMRRSG